MKRKSILVLFIMVSFLVKGQIINPGFELWDTTTSNSLYPRGWTSLASTYCVRSANANEGTYALQVGVWYYYVKSIAAQTLAISERPVGLSGSYTYTDNIIKRGRDSRIIEDTATVNVYATKWNNARSQNDTVGRGFLILDSVAVYHSFFCPIAYTDSDQPDSISIVINPSLATGYGSDYNSTSQSGFSSLLTIDKLSLENATGINDHPAVQLSIYPNPVSDNVLICANENQYSILVTNELGQVCQQEAMNNSNSAIDVSHLAPGIYLLSLMDENGSLVVSRRIVKY